MDDNVEELFSEEEIIEESFEETDNSNEISTMEIPEDTPTQNFNNQVFNTPNVFRYNSTNDSTTSEKLRNLGKNGSFPQLGASNFNNNENISDDSQNELINNNENMTTDSTSQSIDVKTIINSKITSELMFIFAKKYKIQITIACIVVVCVLLLVICVIGVFSNYEEVGSNTYTYVTGEMSEKELVNELIYYDYCDDVTTCNSKGIYKFLSRLKVYYEDYQKDCPSNVKIDKPCEVTLNIPLIIETANYYQASGEQYDSYEDKSVENEEFAILGFFSNLYNRYQKQKAFNDMIKDLENLVLAQAEYVEETCQYLSQAEKTEDLKDKKVDNKENQHTVYYYQISYDKYISYLKYGETSTHPNYLEKKPVKKKNEICEYAVHDYQ